MSGELEQRLDTDARRTLNRYDRYWGPQLLIAAAILLDLSLSEKLTVGPNWLLPSMEGLALIGLVTIGLVVARAVNIL